MVNLRRPAHFARPPAAPQSLAEWDQNDLERWIQGRLKVGTPTLPAGTKNTVVDVHDKLVVRDKLELSAQAQASIAGTLIATMEYGPASSTATTFSSTSFSFIDSTNLKTAFAAPASGNVLIALSLTAQKNTSGLFYLGLADVDTGLQVGKQQLCTELTTPIRFSSFFLVTGLVGGQTYSFGIAGRNSVNSTIIFHDDAVSGSGGGPVEMVVWGA